MSLPKRLVFVFGGIVLLILLLRTTTFAQVGAGKRFKSQAAIPSNKIFVKLKSEPNTVAIQSVSNAIAGKFLSTLAGSNTVVYQVSDVNGAIASAYSNSNVAYAGQVPKVYLTMTTNDTHFDKQWALPNMIVGGSGSTAWDLLGDVAGKTAAVKVAVVDTGVDKTHPDLAGKIADSDFVGCNSSGCATSVSGSDDFGHGTHVSGIIGALTNNSKGIAGVGWGVRLMSAKILDSQGRGDLDVALQGVKWAADNGAKVINMSFGAPANGLSQTDKDTIQAMMDYAWGKGAVLVAAAGNCGGADYAGDPGCSYGPTPIFIQNPVMYPAASNHVISVAALAKDNSKAPYSESGSWVDVAAPGGYCTNEADAGNCILSTWPAYLITGQPPAPTPQYNYQYAMGTSMASPQVVGAAALVFAANPSLTNDQVKSFIENNTNIDSGGSGISANGEVDACSSVYAALNNGGSPPNGVCVLGANTGVTPTSAPNNTANAPTAFPTGVSCPAISASCQQFKGKGDANCDGVVDDTDYLIWKNQFGSFMPSLSNNDANFACTNSNSNTYIVNLVDFEKWRSNTVSFGSPTAGGPTVTPGGPSDTPEPAGPSDTPGVPTPTTVAGAPTPTLPPGVGAGTYDDRSPSIIYNATTWVNINNVTGAFKSTLKRSKTANDTATLNFTGTAATIRFSEAQNRGKADIIIDGATKATVDTYGPTGSGLVWFGPYTVPSGNHTLVIKVDHTKNPKASDFYVALDAIKIQ